METLLSREIEAFHRRIEGAAWEASSRRAATPHVASDPSNARGKKDSSRRGPAGQLRVSRGDLLPEVVELEEFVRTQGHAGGWSHEDHSDFLRLFQRCGQSYTRVLAVCLAQMPHLSREEIVGHCKWDAEYKNLVIRRRQVIQAWRERKNVQKEAEKKKR